MLSGGQRKRVGLAQVLIRDPKILLMDEPFGPLDAQTRQIMGNLLLDLWSADRKAVLFVTHDLEEAIALSDRVVIMSAGPAARIIGNWRVPLPRPRDIAEIKADPAFHQLHREIWQTSEGRSDEGLRPDRRRVGRCFGSSRAATIAAIARQCRSTRETSCLQCVIGSPVLAAGGCFGAWRPERPCAGLHSPSRPRTSRTANGWPPRWPATTSPIRIASARTSRRNCPGPIRRRAPRAMRC